MAVAAANNQSILTAHMQVITAECSRYSCLGEFFINGCLLELLLVKTKSDVLRLKCRFV